MAFRVEVSPRALEDLDAIASYITAHGSHENARKWFNEMIDAIASLRRMPHRCPVAEVSQDLGQEVRILLHGSPRHAYQIFFAVRERSRNTGAVNVLHVRHWARRGLRADELEQRIDEASPDES